MRALRLSITAILVLTVITTVSVGARRAGASSATFFGPTPYLSTADIPVGFFSGAYALETFEDGTLDFGLSATGNGTFIIAPSNITDSVDADDGTIDGSGVGGRSYVADGSPGVLFTFPEPLPTAAGVVWTDGGVGATTTFEAFGPGMVSLGTVQQIIAMDSQYYGETAEDRFFGVQDSGGILAIKVVHPFGQVEVDHVMFGGSAAPPQPPACAFTFTRGTGASLIRYCVSDRGTIVKLEAPAGQEHLANGEVWEGFVVCSGSTVQAYDLTGGESGFGPASVLKGPSGTGVTLRRTSAQFRLDQVFALDAKEKDITVTMTLTNLTGAPIPDVRIARAYDPDIDNGTSDDVEAKSLRGIWAGGANATTLTGTTWGFAVDAAVDTGTTPACSPASGPSPVTTGDANLGYVTYRVGNIAAGAKKQVTFVYRAQ